MKKILLVLCAIFLISGCSKKDNRVFDENGFEVRIIELQELGVPLKYDVYPSKVLYHADHQDSKIDKMYGREDSLFLMAFTESLFNLQIVEEIDMEYVNKSNEKDIITFVYDDGENYSVELRKLQEPKKIIVVVVGNKAYQIANFKELYSNLGRLVEIDEEGNYKS